MRRAVIFNYNSIFAINIVTTIEAYNLLHPKEAFLVDMYRAEKHLSELQTGPADIIIHSGGDGIPVREDVMDTPKLYICHSHQWKAGLEGGKLAQLKKKIFGIRNIDVLEDDDILGRKGKMPIMQYHELAVVSPPSFAKVIATSKARDLDGKEIEAIEVLRYPNGSMGIQGHPEEGRALHILYNFFEQMEGRLQHSEKALFQHGYASQPDFTTPRC